MPVDAQPEGVEFAGVVDPAAQGGEVVFVDHFGNLITNIPGDALATWATVPWRITVADHEVCQRVRTYAEAEPGALVALVSSTGTLEVAINQGNAAARLEAHVGSRVTVTGSSAPPHVPENPSKP